MVSAQAQWKVSCQDAVASLLVKRFTGFADFPGIAGAAVFDPDGLRNGDRYVAAVMYVVSQLSNPASHVCDAKSGGAHVDAAPVCTQVERNTDDVDNFHEARGPAAMTCGSTAGAYCSKFLVNR